MSLSVTGAEIEGGGAKLAPSSLPLSNKVGIGAQSVRVKLLTKADNRGGGGG